MKIDALNVKRTGGCIETVTQTGGTGCREEVKLSEATKFISKGDDWLD